MSLIDRFHYELLEIEVTISIGLAELCDVLYESEEF